MKMQLKNSLILTLICCLFSVVNFAQVDNSIEVTMEPAPPPEHEYMGPITKINWENDTEFDFGTIKEGEIVTHTFTFTNIGDEVLIIGNAKGSCGCTVPAWPREPIPPGETASITVEFNSKSKKGPRVQKVVITANTDPLQTYLYLKGTVEVIDEEEYIKKIETDPETQLASMDCIVMYPNPTSDLLKLDLKESIGKSAEIGIYSKVGQLMAKKSIDNIEDTIEFSVGHYPTGAYIAKVQVEGQEPIARCFVVSK